MNPLSSDPPINTTALQAIIQELINGNWSVAIPSEEGKKGLLTQLEQLRQSLQEREENRESLWANKEIMTTLLEQLPVGVYIMDKTGKPVYANKRSLQILGRGIAPMLNEEKLTEVYQTYKVDSEELYPTAELPILRGLKGETAYVDDMEIRNGGKRTLIEVWATPCYDTAGEISHSIAVFNDITQRSAAEKERSKYEKFFTMSLDMLCIAGTDGYFKRINPAFSRVLGYDESELLGKPFIDFVHPDDVTATLIETENLSLGLPTISFENRYRAKDGSFKWFHWTASPDPQTGELFAVAHDITELKMARLKLEKTNQELDQFAYIVSHDLKAPLRAINSLSEWIEEDLGDNLEGDVRKNMGILRARVQRMEGMINGILQYSKAGKASLQTEKVEIGNLIQTIYDNIPKPDAFQMELHNSLTTIHTHKLLLEQVLANLMSNAIKYHNRENGKVTITAKKLNEDWLEFTVADDGPGINPKYHETIFGIFQTLEAKDKFESTGIGLSLVKKIVEDAGGQVTLVSAVGQGASFHFTWPQVQNTLPS